WWPPAGSPDPTPGGSDHASRRAWPRAEPSRHSASTRWAPSRGSSGLRSNDAAKTDVAGRGIHCLPLACGRAIAVTVVRRAEMRATLGHAARDGLAGSEAGRLARDAWVDRGTTR